MKILIATGRLAESTVRKAVKEKADILVMDIDIAAFITPGKLIKAFKEAKYPGKYDLDSSSRPGCGRFFKSC